MKLGETAYAVVKPRGETAILWIAVAPNDCYYVIDEIYQGETSVAQHAEASEKEGETMKTYTIKPLELEERASAGRGQP